MRFRRGTIKNVGYLESIDQKCYGQKNLRVKKTNCCNACVGPEDRCLFLSGRFATSLCAHGRKKRK